VGEGWEEMRSQNRQFPNYFIQNFVLFPESINTIQNNVKMATIFSPLLPPTWVLPTDLVQKVRLM
jgi:hypothetical protein